MILYGLSSQVDTAAIFDEQIFVFQGHVLGLFLEVDRQFDSWVVKSQVKLNHQILLWDSRTYNSYSYSFSFSTN